MIQATLKQTVTGTKQTLTPYTNSIDVHGQIRQCIYKTSLGTTITVAVTSGAQILAFVDAENAAFEANTGYQNSQVLKKHVIPVFGQGNDAWAIKEGGTLAALYQSNSVVITAPYTTVAQPKRSSRRCSGFRPRMPRTSSRLVSTDSFQPRTSPVGTIRLLPGKSLGSL